MATDTGKDCVGDACFCDRSINKRMHCSKEARTSDESNCPYIVILSLSVPNHDQSLIICASDTSVPFQSS